MELLIENPIVWIAIAIFVVILIVVISVLVGKKRSREVEELDQMFSEGNLAGEDLGKISVEKVRRNALEREKRKKELQHLLPVKERPKKGEKVIPDEDKEIILSPILSDSRPNPTVTKARESANVKGGRKAKDDQRQKQAPEEIMSDRQLSPSSSEKSSEGLDPNLDPQTSRQLYKKSLLSPERMDGDEEEDISLTQSQQAGVSNPSSSGLSQKNALGNLQAESSQRMGGLPKRTSRSSDNHSTPSRPRELPSRSKRRPPSKNTYER